MKLINILFYLMLTLFFSCKKRNLIGQKISIEGHWFSYDFSKTSDNDSIFEYQETYINKNVIYTCSNISGTIYPPIFYVIKKDSLYKKKGDKKLVFLYKIDKKNDTLIHLVPGKDTIKLFKLQKKELMLNDFINKEGVYKGAVYNEFFHIFLDRAFEKENSFLEKNK